MKINPHTLDYELPSDRIAQRPLRERDAARLMVVDRSRRRFEHRLFRDLSSILRPSDVLVINATRVNPARFFGKKPTGGRVEILFIRPNGDKRIWSALVRPAMKNGTEVLLSAGGTAVIQGDAPTGEKIVRCVDFDPEELMRSKGTIPLPPYIKRTADEDSSEDAAFYQTVYASRSGSVAAPTAGLHFTERLLSQLRENGVIIVEITLHVGWGTFRPIAAGLDRHRMLPERYSMSADAFEKIQRAKRIGRRIISVGTTSTRALESIPPSGTGFSLEGETNIFIRPGHRFNWVSGLITNFHVPRSTPIALTAAFCGFDLLEEAYAAALKENYRFYSYGDAMIILE